MPKYHLFSLLILLSSTLMAAPLSVTSLDGEITHLSFKQDRGEGEVKNLELSIGTVLKKRSARGQNEERTSLTLKRLSKTLSIKLGAIQAHWENFPQWIGQQLELAVDDLIISAGFLDDHNISGQLIQINKPSLGQAVLKNLNASCQSQGRPFSLENLLGDCFTSATVSATQVELSKFKEFIVSEVLPPQERLIAQLQAPLGHDLKLTIKNNYFNLSLLTKIALPVVLRSSGLIEVKNSTVVVRIDSLRYGFLEISSMAWPILRRIMSSDPSVKVAPPYITFQL